MLQLQVKLGLRACATVLICSLAFPVQAAFTFQDSGSGIGIRENGSLVLVYNYGGNSTENADPTSAPLAGYIHPLYDLQGEEITAISPDDASYHRGLFWAWPDVIVEDGPLNILELDDAHQVFQRLISAEATETRATLVVQNAWILHANGRVPVMETIEVTVWPANFKRRWIDLTLSFTNVSEGPVALNGKTGGGLYFRPNESLGPFEFAAPGGKRESLEALVRTRWVDVSYKIPRSSSYAGLAITNHPDNPTGKFSLWGLDATGLIEARGLGLSVRVLEPGETLRLSYRLVIHRGSGEHSTKVIEEAYSDMIGCNGEGSGAK